MDLYSNLGMFAISFEDLPHKFINHCINLKLDPTEINII